MMCRSRRTRLLNEALERALRSCPRGYAHAQPSPLPWSSRSVSANGRGKRQGRQGLRLQQQARALLGTDTGDAWRERIEGANGAWEAEGDDAARVAHVVQASSPWHFGSGRPAALQVLAVAMAARPLLGRLLLLAGRSLRAADQSHRAACQKAPRRRAELSAAQTAVFLGMVPEIETRPRSTRSVLLRVMAA